jgi:hypothetical protein
MRAVLQVQHRFEPPRIALLAGRLCGRGWALQPLGGTHAPPACYSRGLQVKTEIGALGIMLAIAAATACGPSRAPAKPVATNVRLAVLPAESDAFPKAAQAATDSLSNATIGGIDQKQLSKVSLEVVQLSIECVEPTVACYEAVGKTLSANRLLFAQIAPDGKQVKVSVTLFDVDASVPRTVQKLFDSEQAATAGIGDLVAEATR